MLLLLLLGVVLMDLVNTVSGCNELRSTVVNTIAGVIDEGNIGVGAHFSTEDGTQLLLRLLRVKGANRASDEGEEVRPSRGPVCVCC